MVNHNFSSVRMKMCRLYAIISESFISGSLIESALDFLIPLSEKHKDGWGVGYYNFGRSGVHRSDKSLYMDNMPETTRENIRNSKIAIFHIRKASPGLKINMNNVHPFKIENYIFAHNGTIHEYKDHIFPHLSKKVQSELTKDRTDSEAMFYFLYDKLIQGYSYKESFENLVDVLDESYSALNTLLSDGLFLYISNIWTKRPRYHSLYYKKIETNGIHSILIRSTQDSIHNNLDEDVVLPDSSWNLIGNHKLMKISPDLRIEFEDI